MSSFTIRCGAAHQSKRSRPTQVTLYGFLPKTTPPGSRSYASQTRVQVLKRSAPANNKFSALAVETAFKVQRRPVATKVSPKGCWRKKLAVTDTTNVQHQHRQQSKPKKKAVSPGRKLTRSCAYCHDEEHIHHIRDCPILAEKNRKKAEFSRKQKEEKKQAKLRAAEARLAEQVRLAQMAKETPEVMEEDTSGSESEVESDEEFPALTAAIASGHVTVKRGSNWGASRRVTFKDDSENLMKPPCETKVFNTHDAPTAISDEEEEEEILLKPSANAWKPRRSRTATPSPQQQLILGQIKEKEAELASYSHDSWADACEIEELESEIAQLKAKLA